MNAPSQTRATEDQHRAEITRIVRRIYLLREQGEVIGAHQVGEAELGNAIRDFRLAHGPDAFTEQELQEIHRREEQRVADAAVLAELLIPKLKEAYAQPVRAIVPVNESRMREVRDIESPVGGVGRSGSGRDFSADSDSESVSAAPDVSAPAGSPAIPDLLDAMLAAERSSRRTTTGQRS